MPQEVFLDLVLFGYNWWTEYTDDLNEALGYHEGLQYLKSLEHWGFDWPSTESAESTDPSTIQEGLREETPLHKAGYMIRDNSTKIPREVRWATLKNIVDTDKVSLEESAATIASHIRMRRRQQGGEEKFWYAIGEWEHDLGRLKTTCYDGNNYTFVWPTTSA